MDRKLDVKVVIFAVGLIFVGLFILPLFTVFFNNDEYTVENNPVEKVEFFDGDISNYPSMLTAEDGVLKNADGKEIVLKGLTAPDPHRLNQAEVYSTSYYQGIFDLGGNVLRVPVHPSRYLSDEYYIWRFIDPIIKWAGENKFYVIIDWDCSGSPLTGEGDNLTDIADDVTGKSVSFWKKIAHHYKDTPNVVFEIFNEPKSIRADKWGEIANSLIASIREEGANQLIIVGSIEGGRDITWAKDITFDDDNLALGMHVFPGYDDYATLISEYDSQMPLIITSWGYCDSDITPELEYMGGSEEDFAKPFIELTNSESISWVAAYYDDKLEPQMYYPDTQNLTNWGKFIQRELKK